MKTIFRRLAKLVRGRPIRYDHPEAHRPIGDREVPIEAALIPPRSLPSGN